MLRVRSSLLMPCTALLLLCGSAASAQPAQAQAPPPSGAGGTVDFEAIRKGKVYRAIRTTEPIVLDGRIDEPAWAGAQVGGDFYQSEPRTGQPAPDKTEFRILYDDRNVYVAVDARQTGPITTN